MRFLAHRGAPKLTGSFQRLSRAPAELKILCQMLLTTFEPDNRLVAESLEAEWNDKLRSLAEAQQQYEQQMQKQRLLVDSQARATALVGGRLPTSLK
jgi:hypothetical protein